MPSMNGITRLQRIREVDHEVPVILVTGHADVQVGVSAMRRRLRLYREAVCGAVFGGCQFAARWTGAASFWRTNDCGPSPGSLTTSKRSCGDAPGDGGPALKAASIGATDADTVIIGETAVGKEVVLRALHEMSAAGQAAPSSRSTVQYSRKSHRKRVVRPRAGYFPRSASFTLRQVRIRTWRHNPAR